ncbi:O-antigen ligase [Psychroserpens sp. SPM9]|uniref:O-antigen ligase family protein n=1 Tax=Psychroserpens sp. SPM9 TaxID=2975598 RepID=UPI0021A73B42|nr:O-antigen ligase family protein [Psychroserpens sp. SPM9]MDG5491653.1 O-antigen ligase family protein [Psychroserpens sp. SPM9]
MKIIKYLTLIMVLWGIPSFFSYDESIGSKMSYLTYILLIIYYFISTKGKLLIPFLILGISYFVISGFTFVNDVNDYTYKLVKYIIFIVSGAELARNTTKKEFFILAILGSLSILIHAVAFPNGYGRYSGFYLNPNGAGFVCIIGYCLSYVIEDKKLRLIGQFILTFAGIITFSRTFISLWLIVSLLSILADKRNSLTFGLGAVAIVVVFSLASFLKFNSVRFSAFEGLLTDQSESSISTIKDGSRLDTWSVYYDEITTNPIFGNGFQMLSGLNHDKQGVHNTFLMVLGESGIFPFLLIIGIYLFMLKRSYGQFTSKPHLLMLTISMVGILMIMHNYFDNNLILFTSIWIFVRLIDRHFVEETHEEAVTEDELINKTITP